MELFYLIYIFSIIDQVVTDVNESIEGSTFFRKFRMTGLVSLFHKIVELVKILVRFLFFFAINFKLSNGN